MIIVPGYLGGGIVAVTAGDGLSGGGSSGTISVAIDFHELTAAAVADGDFIPIIDTNDSNGSRKEAVADLATLFAGDGLTASSSVLAVNVDDSTIETSSDAIRIKDNGVSLAKMAGLTRGSIIYGNASGDPAALAKGSANYVLTSDGTDIAWAAAATGDITGVTAGDGLSGGGSSGGVTVTLDLNELTAAAVADGDFIPIIDTNDSNGSRKEAVHDLATLFAGTGLTATNSVIAVDAAQSQITTIGTIGTGVWQGTAVASAYLDADTAHLSGTQTFSGAKTFSDDITMAADKSLLVPQNGKVKFTDAITQDSIDDHDAQGIIMTFQAGSTVTPFSPVYLGTDDEVHECDADAIATMPAIGVSINTSNVTDGNSIEVMLLGLIREESFTDFGTNGAPVFVSTTVVTMSNTAPSGDDDVVQIIGHSIGEKLLFVQPSLTYLVVDA